MSDSFHQERAKGIGGSDIGAIMGWSNWAGIWDVLLDKRGLKPPVEETDDMRWGKRLEQAIADQWLEVNGKAIGATAITPCDLLVHPKYPWARGHVDFLVLNGARVIGILEVKCPRGFKADEWGQDGSEAGAGTAPKSYRAQLTWYLGILSALRNTEHFGMQVSPNLKGYFAVSLGDRKPIHLQFDYDPDLFEMLLKEGEKFWTEYVIGGKDPDIDETAGCKLALNERWKGKTTDKPKEVPDAEHWAIRRAQAIDAKKLAEADYEYANNKLRELMAESTVGIAGKFNISYKFQAGRRSVDMDKLEAMFPDAYKECVGKGEGDRVLRVSERKEKK